MGYVFARDRFIKFHPDTGLPHVFGYGQRVEDGDPIVAASPTDFMSPDEWSRSSVEQATAAPGERRNVVRR